jgi:hypothetical protein
MGLFGLLVSIFLGFPGKTYAATDRSVHSNANIYRDKAKIILTKYCGQCHVPGRRDSKEALNIFNLSEEYWYMNFSKERLRSSLNRLKSFSRANGAQLRNMEGLPRFEEPIPVTPADLKDFQKFVEHENHIRK